MSVRIDYGIMQDILGPKNQNWHDPRYPEVRTQTGSRPGLEKHEIALYYHDRDGKRYRVLIRGELDRQAGIFDLHYIDHNRMAGPAEPFFGVILALTIGRLIGVKPSDVAESLKDGAGGGVSYSFDEGALERGRLSWVLHTINEEASNRGGAPPFPRLASGVSTMWTSGRRSQNHNGGEHLVASQG